MARILVVEDEAPVRDNIVELLQAEGFDTIEARDGVDGLRAARQEMPDLILCDIRMPRLDGFGLLAQLIHDPLIASIPFIFLTARTEAVDQRQGMGLGADDYVTKPFTRHDLLTSVRRRLEKRAILASRMEQKMNELGAYIDQSFPGELLAPLSVLLSHSEMLVKTDWIESDPIQVRGTAREINRAALRVKHLIQNYILITELDKPTSSPQEQSKLEQMKTHDSVQVLAAFARDVASEFNRAEDLTVSLEPVEIAIPERYLLVIIEELLDHAFRESIPGSPVELDARFLDERIYQIRVRDKGNRFLPQIGVRKSLYVDYDESPLGFLLIRRIVANFQGRFHFTTDADGSSRAECELVGIRPIR